MEATSRITTESLGPDVDVVELIKALRRGIANLQAMERHVLSVCVEDALNAGGSVAVAKLASDLALPFRVSDMTMERHLGDAWA